MEVTQFTYFQQAGSFTLPVPAVEITYGLERILMSLQNVMHFKNIRYNDQITYEEFFMQNEEEMSHYNLEEADIQSHWKRFELYKFFYLIYIFFKLACTLICDLEKRLKCY